MKLTTYIASPSWKKALEASFLENSFENLEGFINDEFSRENIYPPREEIFSAFNLTPLDSVRVVILGQDPYHGENQAHGLAFSVKAPCVPPPSLKNIFKELNISPDHGDLTHWAQQGVFLLNTVLTVRQAQANSHRKKGWEEFTDSVISAISKENDFVIFVLWGSPAQKKKKLIDEQKHLILESVHPSPLSAYRGFFGCDHFNKINESLRSKGHQTIDWNLPALQPDLFDF